MYRYIKGKIDDIVVEATWQDGAITGDREFIRAIFETAIRTPLVRATPPSGVIETKMADPRCFIPLAAMTLDEVISTSTDELFEPGTLL